MAGVPCSSGSSSAQPATPVGAKTTSICSASAVSRLASSVALPINCDSA
ncbi:MAG: hypothetical protein ABI068_05685 [Ktedonobacterales bacterium]